MSTVTESGFKTFQATAVAIGSNVRVKVDSSGLISAAAATDAWVGTTVEDVALSGYGTVRLRNDVGTRFFTASGAVAVGAELYPTASGKVDDAAGTGQKLGFIALGAASADGDMFEAAPADLVGYTAAAAQAAVITTGATNSSPYGFATAAQADAIVTLVNALRSACVTAGIIKGAA